MTSWRDELPEDLPREQMMEEAIRRGTRRRRRRRRNAAVGGSLGLLVTAMVALVALPLTSRGDEGDVQVVGTVGADPSAGSTPLAEPALAPGDPPTTADLPPQEPPPTVPPPGASELAPAVVAPAAAAPPAVAAPATVATQPVVPPSTASPPGPTTTRPAGQPGAPVFLSATGNAATQRLLIRFDRPVVAGTVHLAPMYLVVHQAGDSRCSTPNGNAHEYLAGVGTDTITTDATSLVVGTTYISIASGFVKNASDGTENATVACVAIPVKG